MTTNWFRYHDDNKDKDFYYNTETQETVWRYPTDNAIVWDAVTREQVPPPQESAPSSSSPSKSHSKHRSKSSASKTSSGDRARRSMTMKVSKVVIKNQTNDLFTKMIQDYASMTVNFDEFASLFLKKQKTFEYSNQPLKDNLIVTLKKNEVKLALKMNKLVLKLTGASSQKKSELLDLIHAIKENKFLVDEIYCQVWKQLINAPPDSLNVGLQTFLVLATLFMPGLPLHKFLLHHIATLATDNDYAKFVFIRLQAICSNINGEQTLVFDDDASILAIPSHPTQALYNFGVSLWEISFHQKRTLPKLPIPKVMYEMTTHIKKFNGFTKVGIFRLPGNMKRVEALIYKGNHGEEYLEGEDIETVASLFKRWLRDIPGKIINEELVFKLMEIGNSDEAIKFAEELEFPFKMVLRFLAGFLRDVAQSKDVNQMHEKNLAMVFGPNVVSSNDKVNPMELQARVQFFMQSLIEKWDVSDIYPLPQELLSTI
ncbi:Rho GTPase activating protein 39 [Tritrichomonas musculus]|uniref:Rho GTPase activating protein 39 n=1 Tax=Tritrichomonas musculus TaxID=1915356 RepID=A0ABR2GVT5_9EUKA